MTTRSLNCRYSPSVAHLRNFFCYIHHHISFHKKRVIPLLFCGLLSLTGIQGLQAQKVDKSDQDKNEKFGNEVNLVDRVTCNIFEQKTFSTENISFPHHFEDATLNSPEINSKKIGYKTNINSKPRLSVLVSSGSDDFNKAYQHYGKTSNSYVDSHLDHSRNIIF